MSPGLPCSSCWLRRASGSLSARCEPSLRGDLHCLASRMWVQVPHDCREGYDLVRSDPPDGSPVQLVQLVRRVGPGPLATRPSPELLVLAHSTVNAALGAGAPASAHRHVSAIGCPLGQRCLALHAGDPLAASGGPGASPRLAAVSRRLRTSRIRPGVARTARALRWPESPVSPCRPLPIA